MGKRRRATLGRKSRPAQALPTPAPTQTPFDRERTTKRRGEISELAFALAAARNGFGISKPFGDSERYDIILDPVHLMSVIPTEAQRSKRSGEPALSLSKGTCFPVSSRPRLVRVQVKSTTSLLFGLYHVTTQRKINGRFVPYELSEIDFIAAYVIPEDSWFIFPLAHILGQATVLVTPKNYPRAHPYDAYREAWQHLRAPDGLEFA